jgi:hypothetical protein
MLDPNLLLNQLIEYLAILSAICIGIGAYFWIHGWMEDRKR